MERSPCGVQSPLGSRVTRKIGRVETSFDFGLSVICRARSIQTFPFSLAWYRPLVVRPVVELGEARCRA